MNITHSEYTIADYCAALQRGEIVTNSEYQRSDKVWPDAARSFLIETILLGFPVPKLYLHQKTDLKTRKTLKEIVDGQQRSRAIRDFFDDKLSLGNNLDSDFAGSNYSQLTGEQQKRFLDYSIAVDLFTGVSSEEIIEVFRRMNSYTVPLNPEEQRHAVFQGAFTHQ